MDELADTSHYRVIRTLVGGAGAVGAVVAPIGQVTPLVMPARVAGAQLDGGLGKTAELL